MKWKFLYQITAASRLGGYRPQIPVLSVLCPQLNLLNPPTEKEFLGTPLAGIKEKVKHLLPLWVFKASYRVNFTFCSSKQKNDAP